METYLNKHKRHPTDTCENRKCKWRQPTSQSKLSKSKNVVLAVFKDPYSAGQNREGKSLLHLRKGQQYKYSFPKEAIREILKDKIV